MKARCWNLTESAKEVDQFRRKHTKRPLIPINIDRTIEKLKPQVLKKLEVAPRFIRANARLRLVFAAIFLRLIGLTSLAGYEAWDANHKVRDTTAMRLGCSQRANHVTQGLLFVRAKGDSFWYIGKRHQNRAIDGGQNNG